MKLLRFTVKNHRSIRDEQTLDFAPKLGGLNRPRSGSWDDVIDNTAVIFGPNAAGKTNFIDAISFAMQAIIFSGTRWQEKKYIPHFPSIFNEEKNSSSLYEFDFIASNKNRYLYGFEITKNGVQKEWLSFVKNSPRSRWIDIFEREEKGDDTRNVVWNDRHVSPKSQREIEIVGKNELFLSSTMRLPKNDLRFIFEEISQGINILPLGDNYTKRRIDSIIKSILRGQFDLEELSSLMKIADTGIVSVEIDERKVPEELLKIIKDIQKISSSKKRKDQKNDIQATDDEIQEVAYSLLFSHANSKGEIKKLKIADESSGTLAWLSIAPIILESLKEGSIVIADELDTSLHQTLIESIIQLYTNPSINQNGAQLIFTSHNTNYLEHIREIGISTNQIWFVEKNKEGSSEIYSLGDFKTPDKANFERRYLSGRYGAIPRVSDGLFASMITNEDYSYGN